MGLVHVGEPTVALGRHESLRRKGLTRPGDYISIKQDLYAGLFFFFFFFCLLSKTL